jgi:hypothetical protein
MVTGPAARCRFPALISRESAASELLSCFGARWRPADAYGNPGALMKTKRVITGYMQPVPPHPQRSAIWHENLPGDAAAPALQETGAAYLRGSAGGYFE